MCLKTDSVELARVYIEWEEAVGVEFEADSASIARTLRSISVAVHSDFSTGLSLVFRHKLAF